MNLKEFMIRRYGPLPDSGLKQTGPFNLFFGPNEEGKTLTIDALLRMLMGKGVNHFKGIGRVDENPEGFLIIEEQAGEEIKLPEAGTVEDLFGISPAEFSNIFVIRDSDLSINEENTFYRNITNRLTGLRTGEIEKLKRKVCELGGITAGGEYLNTAPLKLKDKIIKGRSLLERAAALLAQLQEEGFSRFEEELSGLDARRRAAAEKINLYRAAENRELYEKGSEALKRLEIALAETETLLNYNQEDYEDWQRAESSLDHYRRDLEHLESEIAEHGETLESARSELNEIKRTYKKAEQEAVAAAEKIEPKLAEYEQVELDLHRQGELVNSPFYNRTATVTALILVLSLAGLSAQPHWWLLPVFIVSAALTILLAANKYSYLHKKGRMASIEAGICSEAGKAGLPADHIRAVRSALGALKTELSAKSARLGEVENWLEWQQKEERRLRADREEKLRRIGEAEGRAALIRRKAGLESLEEYSATLGRRDQLKGEIEKQESILASHFKRAGELPSTDARIAFWHEQVAKLQGYSGAAKGLSFDQAAYAGLIEQKEKLEHESRDLSEKMQERTNQLRDIEKEAGELLHADREGALVCQTTVDLEAVQLKVEKWLQTREEDSANAKITRDILSAIEQEEEEKVTALFGPANPVSGYFNMITGGLYREVFFESRENKIKTVRADGTVLEAAQLSGGAYDQLYFVIRLALGEKMLAGSKGFFILDDPFIKADSVRLELLLDMLSTITEQGWQILYFSSKKEVKEALQEKINTGAVKVIKIT